MPWQKNDNPNPLIVISTCGRLNAVVPWGSQDWYTSQQLCRGSSRHGPRAPTRPFYFHSRLRPTDARSSQSWPHGDHVLLTSSSPPGTC
ncbi:hypothetical protein M406DRAFT_58275 [Cryphonectria parasitica EP155]|uniref:Uncharacterized protein n=1 Tax=Cryphonectria parasitica (strain ATCC 38755 / EP155) TaxID=660469 RepID=A0A9P5CJK1_CRYP1|nr:uncharacterized protein M406DRAFT_58275 [Cryphonectria parasitica EP155]KAF3760011.1 hypothetical protein M406DRAFT_58275 [Cryphonectria parasitica EP155]